MRSSFFDGLNTASVRSSSTQTRMGVSENQRDRRLKDWNVVPSFRPISEQEQIFGVWAGKRLDVSARGVWRMCCACMLITRNEHVEHMMSDCVHRDNCDVCLCLSVQHCLNYKECSMYSMHMFTQGCVYEDVQFSSHEEQISCVWEHFDSSFKRSLAAL